MGRFYRTADPKFVEDMIFQPDFTLMEKALLAEDERGVDKLKKIKLLQDIPLHYSKFDEDIVKEYTNKYENSINDIVDRLRKNANDKEALNRINELSSELKKEFTEGVLSNVVKSYNNYYKFMRMKEDADQRDIPILNSIEEDYLKNVGNSAKGVFDPGEIHLWKDWLPDIVKQAKEAGIGVKLTKVESTKKGGGYRWVLSIEDKTDKEKWRDFVRGWMRDNQDFRKWAAFRSKYGESWLNDYGDPAFEDPNSEASKLLSRIDAHATEEHKEVIKNYAIDQYAYQNYLNRLKNKDDGSGPLLSSNAPGQYFKKTRIGYNKTKTLYTQVVPSIFNRYASSLPEGSVVRGFIESFANSLRNNSQDPLKAQRLYNTFLESAKAFARQNNRPGLLELVRQIDQEVGAYNPNEEFETNAIDTTLGVDLKDESVKQAFLGNIEAAEASIVVPKGIYDDSTDKKEDFVLNGYSIQTLTDTKLKYDGGDYKIVEIEDVDIDNMAINKVGRIVQDPETGEWVPKIVYRVPIRVKIEPANLVEARVSEGSEQRGAEASLQRTTRTRKTITIYAYYDNVDFNISQ